MISELHERLGTAGFVISIVALVIALSGGAYAASGGLNGKQKKEVEKIAKKFAGKQGPAGAAGAAGAKGDTGAKGETGGKGEIGATGTAGQAGGQGKEGKEGSPWTAGGVLPATKTETGVWDVETAEPGFTHPTFSYPIPLASAPTTTQLVQEGETGVTGCPAAEPTPEAEPGFLCVYVLQTSRLVPLTQFPTMSTASGAVITMPILEAEGFARGVWAVTAE
jgi:hypothetical protein